MQTQRTASGMQSQAQGTAHALTDSFIPRKALAARLNVSESTTRNMQAAGVIAAPVRISPRRVGWRASYVAQLIDSLQQGNS